MSGTDAMVEQAELQLQSAQESATLTVAIPEEHMPHHQGHHPGMLN
jgi:hypothetical protein